MRSSGRSEAAELPRRRSSSSSVVFASAMILSTSARIQSALRLAPGEALAWMRVESRAMSPTRTSPTSAARRSTWFEQVRQRLVVVSGEPGDGGVVGALVGGDEPEGDVLHAASLDQPRG